MSLKYVCLLMSCLFFQAFSQNNLDSRCTIRGSNAAGVCKLIRDCPEVEEAAKRGVTATTCGFHRGRIPIVCCQEKKQIIVNENTFFESDKSNGGFIFPESNENVWSQSKGLDSKLEEKCHEYSQSVMGIVNAVPLITDPEAVSIDVVNCDNYGLALVVGGSPAAPAEFPFMAALGYNTNDGFGWYCGGTLISDYYVVTAAHCAFTRQYGQPAKVRLGEIDLKHDNDGTEYQDYDVEDIKLHEQYRPPSHYHDIALIKLSKKVQFTKFIRPACLWNKFEIDYKVAIATGWGKTGFVEEQSDKLLKVALDLFNNSVCATTYQSDISRLPNGIIRNMLCAGKLEGGKDTCQGDSGGPLIVTKPRNRCVSYLVGITSFGKGCGGANLPAVYTRISHYIPWIAKHVW
ncbi:hypothetical protein RI129_011989 [Pyrocoelia pectoralis]|uniref:Uncharacterized protein n=1 Tax=Pyrocoelia pectoralis TaxID=417401 RepID=A0AAN7ZDI2_9COLE